jgi:signal transduction histidine kinase
MQIPPEGIVLSTPATIATGAPGSIPGRWRVFFVAAVVAAVAFAAFLALTGFRAGGETLTTAVDDIGEAAAAMVAALSCAFAARRSSGRLRLAWGLLAASAAIWGLGQAIVTFYEVGSGTAVPFPSAADAVFLAATPLAFAGVLAFPVTPVRDASPTRQALDAGILALSLLFVGAALGLLNIGSTSPVTPLAQLVGLSHPLGALLMIVIILGRVRRLGLRLGGPLGFLLVGLAAKSVADTAFAYWIANGPDTAFSRLLEVSQVLGFLLIALAALWPWGGRHSTPEERPVALWQVVMPWMGLPAIGLAFGFLVLTGRPFSPVLAAVGVPLALLLVLSELESRRAEARYRHQKALLDQVIAHSPFGVVRIREDMTLIDARRATASHAGRETRDAHAGTMADFLTPGEMPRVIEKLRQLRDGSVESIESENPGLHADGTKGWWQWTASKVRKEDGSLDYFLILFAETTAEHEAKEAAMANLAGLERLSQLKSEFVSMVSHEFRNALVGIQGFSEVMRDEAITTDEVKEFAGDINSDAMRLNRMITELLDLDRMESGRMTLHRGPVDLNNTVRDAVERARVSSSKHVIKTDLDPALPVVMGDADRLFQVIANLLSNAGKYSPEGSEVLVTSRLLDANVQVSVRDHGQGIPPEFLDRLFGRYERFEGNAKSQVVGTGLGLAITRQIVEMHKGRIWVESTLGVGSVFHFMIPVDARHEAKPLETGDVRQEAGLAGQVRIPA